MTCENCDCFRAGDDVRVKTTGMVGIINSSDETGTYHEIWIYGGGRMYVVPSWQIEFAASPELPAAEQEPADDNVIPVDFTQPRKRATVH